MQEQGIRRNEAKKIALRMKGEGHTYEDISAALAAQGWRGREGKPISKSTLFNLVADPKRATGARVKHKTETVGNKRRVKRGKGVRARVADRGKLEAIRAIIAMKAMDSEQKVNVIESLL